ncbi:hypothetical protein VdG2_03747 [Verticillium dahliae VDG2]|nr:hypothetical protein VdG2_03747 [Verticillium dahliae VDG2]
MPEDHPTRPEICPDRTECLLPLLATEIDFRSTPSRSSTAPVVHQFLRTIALDRHIKVDDKQLVRLERAHQVVWLDVHMRDVLPVEEGHSFYELAAQSRSFVFVNTVRPNRRKRASLFEDQQRSQIRHERIDQGNDMVQSTLSLAQLFEKCKLVGSLVAYKLHDQSILLRVFGLCYMIR